MPTVLVDHTGTSPNALRAPHDQGSADASATSNMSNASSYTFVEAGSFQDVSDAGSIDERETAQQLEALTKALGVENRVKEGAENLLNMQLNDALRLQVESELDMAKKKIGNITRQIEIHNNRGKSRNVNGTGSARRHANQGSALPSEDIDDRDDFRTTLHHAMTYIKTLAALSRPKTSSPLSSGSSSAAGPTAGLVDLDQNKIETMSKLIGILKRNLRVCYELSIAELVQAVIPALADRCSKRCRAYAYRLLRHALVDADSVLRLREQPLCWYMVKSLSRDNKHAIEKEQVIKLIRTIVEVGSERRDGVRAVGCGIVHLSEPVMRALIAVAEHTEDPFRIVCVETLAEILLIDIDLVARTGGIRFLLHTLGDGPLEMGPLLASVFLYLVDSPRTRAYIRVRTDLEIALAPVTDAYGKGPDHAERIRGCARVIQLMLRTWSGLMYFCMDNMLAIRSLIDTLRIPSLSTREMILDMFFGLLNIKTPEWYQTFIAGRRLTMYRRSRQPTEMQKDAEPYDRSQEALKLTDQYMALLLLLLTNAGLLDALTAMLEESTSGSNLSRKATLLMAEVMQMANRVLPLTIAAKIQAVPRAFGLASDYNHGEQRIVGTLAFSAIDSFNRNQSRLHPAISRYSRPRANSSEDAIRRGQRQVEHVKLKIGMSMDDKTFQSSLLETQVMLTKDHSKWNFDILHELVEGPLLNPKRMEEAIKVYKFIRKLMSFFHPFSHRFSDMRRIPNNIRWVRLGCSLLTTLMASQDGIRFLSSEDDFLKEIVKGFAQLDPFNGTQDSDPIFSKKRVSDTLTYGYLEMLGTLSKSKEGVELMEKVKVFTAFYHLSELRSREDLIKGIIEHLDYSFDGHPRIVLSKALTSSYKHIRLYATNHLGELIRASSNANAWTLRLLLTQLYDPAPEVCEMAVHFLQEACEDKDILQLVVEMQPTMDHLGAIGHPLLLKFMSTPMGFRYLYDAGYIDREIDMWFHERNIFYVVQIEVFLAKFFNNVPVEDDEDVLEFDGTVPPHFYGEMSKTELGCQVLNEKGHFSEFADFIRQHGLESEDPDLILKLKSILWAVGNIGATEGGLPFLEDEEIIPSVLEIAEQSPIPSVRGTCFFVLGLVSSTSQGAEILVDYRWEATLSPLGTPTGLCIPMDVEKLISLSPWDPPQLLDEGEPPLLPPPTQPEVEVITAIQNLANTVIANAASRSLAKMKSRPEYRSTFSSPAMFFRALHTISTQRYRLPVRRYILDLFNIELDHEVVLSLHDYAKSLRAPSSLAPRHSLMEPLLGRLGRKRSATESDGDESDLDDPAPSVGVKVKEQRLEPLSKVVGFAI